MCQPKLFSASFDDKFDLSGGAYYKTGPWPQLIGGACYNNIGGCAASTQIGPQTHAMTLKKVLADTKTLFQMIPKRQRNLIRHNEDQTGKKCESSGDRNFHEPSQNRVRIDAVSLSAPHPSIVMSSPLSEIRYFVFSKLQKSLR